jgi:transposase
MVHVHGAQAQQLAQATRGVDPAELVAVPVDVGKHAAMALVCDFTGELLARPFEFSMTMAGVALLVQRVQSATCGRAVRLVRVGVEAAGHYHQPLVSAGVLPADWQLVQINPAQVATQRQMTGRRRLKTDALDLVAISDLLRAGHGAGHRVLASALAELAGWVAHRERRVAARTALKNQLLGQVDRAFPGLSSCVSSLFGTKVGRLVLAEFTNPARLATLGVAGFQQVAATRGVQVLAPVAERLVAAAQVAIPTDQAPIARTIIDRDLTLLAAFDAQIAEADKRLAALLPRTPFAVLCSGPGWRVVRAATYGAAVGDPARWPSARQVYRASGLCPATYASAGRRHDGAISREGSVTLRRAVLSLGVGLWRLDPAARAYAALLRARGKPPGVIATAMANRANRIAFAMVRDQRPYDASRWR